MSLSKPARAAADITVEGVKRSAFSITAPTSRLEKLASDVAGGGLGAIHQWITAQAWNGDRTLDARLAALQKKNCTVLNLIAGVIWNDFPLDSIDPEETQKYAEICLERIEQRYAEYIADVRFRMQPIKPLRFAAAAIQKNVPTLGRILLGVSREDLAVARRMIADRLDQTRPHRHFMRATADEPDEYVIAGTVSACVKWMRMALKYETTFYIGNIAHTLEDSRSVVHADIEPPSVKYPYGRVRRIFFFGDQTDHSHSSAESLPVVMDKSTEAHRRSMDVQLALRAVFSFFLTGMEKLAELGNRPAARSEAIRELCNGFGVFLMQKIFVHVDIASLENDVPEPVPLPRKEKKAPSAAASAASTEEDDADFSGSDSGSESSDDESSGDESLKEIGTDVALMGAPRRRWRRGRRGPGRRFRRGYRRGWRGRRGPGFGAGLALGALTGAVVSPYGPFAAPYYDPLYYDRYGYPLNNSTVVVQQQPAFVVGAPGTTTTTTTYLNSELSVSHQQHIASSLAYRRRVKKMEKIFRPPFDILVPVKVIGVHDGDTVKVIPLVHPMDGNKKIAPISIRLARIDAPELAQGESGFAARDKLRALLGFVEGGEPPIVSLFPEESDRYFRTVGTLFVGGVDINLAMVKNGDAHYYPYNKKSVSAEFQEAEDQAKADQIGLWTNGARPQLPSAFRRAAKAAARRERKERRGQLFWDDKGNENDTSSKPTRA